MAVKKKAVRKTAARKTNGANAKAAAAPKPLKAIAAKQTKAQIVTSIAEETGLARKDVSAVFAALGDHVKRHMKKRGSGEFTIPETGVKIRRVKKPRTKARMGRNPFTGEEIKIAAKPAHTAVKVSALKALKDTIDA